jgi:hypothetical protein
MLARFTQLMIVIGVLSALGVPSLVPSALGAQPPRSRSIIDGLVSDSNLVPLGEAVVSVLGSPLRVTTGDNGRFRIVAVPAGQYIVMVHRVGYAPMSAAIQIGTTDTLRFSFAMHRIATALDTVVVSAKRLAARMAEFEERRKLGFGTFITAEDIRQRNPVALGEVLRGIPSISVTGSGYNRQVVTSTRSSRCPMQVVIDGVLLPMPTDLASLVPPSEVAGIEVYAGPATSPVQYKAAGSACGVILIWTK